MIFKQKKSPTIYFSETTQYVSDLEHVTTLRDKCANPKERLDYDATIHCMLEVLLFMNSISQKDRNQLPAAPPVE